MTLLGAHVPATGGVANAPAHGQAIGADVIQIFTRNQIQWKARPVAPDESAAFRQARAASGVRLVLSHGSYLVNLASPEPVMLKKSRDSFVAEIERCHALGIAYLVFHPGAHMGAGDDAGLTTVAASLDHVLDAADAPSVMPLLEVTAGQGSYLGHRFEHIAAILDRAKTADRLGVCLDTCHLLAAGYDITTEARYEDTLGSLDRLCGLTRVKAFHLNDAQKGLGSHLDRHAPVGKGCLGLKPFERILNDPRFAGLPMILETPGPLAAWREEIRLLRGLARRAGLV